MKNSQLSLDKKCYVKFVKYFSGLFCINITWHHGNLDVFSDDTPLDIFKIRNY